ncbi:hypothetical protein QNK12_09915 [Neobacillus cucumis]|nr:hypothetical protein QNK12_09915 [Neobacillus cucumis]
MNSAKLKREIIGLALLADEVTGLLVFVDYSAHVKSISIRVFDNEEAENKIFSGRFYFDFKYESDESEYQRIKEFLQTEISKATEIK